MGALVTTLTNLGSDVVAENTDLSVSLQVSNDVDSDGFFEVSMAKWNSGSQTVGLETSMLTYSSTDYNVLLQGYTIPCTSDDHAGISCIFSVASVTTLEGISSSRDVLRVSGLSSAITAGNSFTFTISDSRFRNPPSTKAIDTFSAVSKRSDGNRIDEQTKGISY